MEIDKSRIKEIGHAGHRQVVFHTLRELLHDWASDLSLGVSRLATGLKSYNGQLMGHTIAEQALNLEVT